MRIISEKAIRDFIANYSDASEALGNWRRAVKAAQWKNQADVKTQFKDSDLVGDKTVFNIAGNRYRLVAFVSFRARIVFVKEILIHSQYDKGKWKL